MSLRQIPVALSLMRTSQGPSEWVTVSIPLAWRGSIVLADVWYRDLFDLDIESRAFVFLLAPCKHFSRTDRLASLTTTAPQHSLGMSMLGKASPMVVRRSVFYVSEPVGDAVDRVYNYALDTSRRGREDQAAGRARSKPEVSRVCVLLRAESDTSCV